MHQLIDKKNKLIIYLIFLIFLSTTSVKFTENKNSQISTINIINVTGISNDESSKILNELNNFFYQNILTIGNEEVKEVLSKYNFIEKYSVKKIYPATININIKPTKFIARIGGKDQLLVGGNGKLIEGKKTTEILPYIFGEFDSKEFLVFKKYIDKSKFSFTEFKTLYFFPSNRWDILTNDNILIKLPQDELSESINLAYKILSNSNFKEKNLIDLRVNNHLIVK